MVRNVFDFQFSGERGRLGVNVTFWRLVYGGGAIATIVAITTGGHGFFIFGIVVVDGGVNYETTYLLRGLWVEGVTTVCNVFLEFFRWVADWCFRDSSLLFVVKVRDLR